MNNLPPAVITPPNLLKKLTIWLALEIILNLLGIDTIADYGEFVFAQHPITHLRLI